MVSGLFDLFGPYVILHSQVACDLVDPTTKYICPVNLIITPQYNREK